MTTVFDARFGQDGVLERVARACHLGVMMGFAVVAVVFNESELIEPIFRATCESKDTSDPKRKPNSH